MAIRGSGDGPDGRRGTRAAKPPAKRSGKPRNPGQGGKKRALPPVTASRGRAIGREDRIARGERIGRITRDERPARGAKPTRDARPARATRDDRPLRDDRASRADKAFRDDRAPRGDRSFRDARPARAARDDRAPRPAKPFRDDRSLRASRPARDARPSRGGASSRDDRFGFDATTTRDPRFDHGDMPAQAPRARGSDAPARPSRPPRDTIATRASHLQRDDRPARAQPERTDVAPRRQPAPLPEVSDEERAQVRTLEVDPDRDGQRLDNFLFNALKGVPKTHVYRLLRTGQVRVNGKRAKPDHRIAGGDKIRLPPVRTPTPEDPVFASERSLADLAACIVLEDKRFIALDKPTGLASHGGSGIKLGAIEMMRQLKPDDTLELVHRLDRDTSGILLFARKRSALTAAQAAMREGRARKRYLALIIGSPKKDRTLVDVPLRKDTLRGGERMVEVADDGKPSLSEFRVLQRYRHVTLVEVLIETGRTHQIRVHAQHMGHPVAGDPKYGDAEMNLSLRGQGLHRLFLHAAELGLELGEAGSYTFNAPLPPELSAVLDRLPPA